MLSLPTLRTTVLTLLLLFNGSRAALFVPAEVSTIVSSASLCALASSLNFNVILG